VESLHVWQCAWGQHGKNYGKLEHLRECMRMWRIACRRNTYTRGAMNLIYTLLLVWQRGGQHAWKCDWLRCGKLAYQTYIWRESAPVGLLMVLYLGGALKLLGSSVAA